MANLILTHNLGTKGDRACIYDESGSLVSSWLETYPCYYAMGDRAEQNPMDWWRAICVSTKKVMRGINEKDIDVITFSGQMMGCLCIDRFGQPLGNAIIWSDVRSKKEAQKLSEQIDGNLFFQITGHKLSPSYTLSKLLWVKNNESDKFANTSKILQAKDFIVYKLTGNMVTDYSDASGTNMFNLKKRKWSRTILSIADIAPQILPDVCPSTAIVGKVTMEAAMETNLLPGTPVVIGGGDGITAAIAGGCTSEKDAYLYYGSSAWIGLCKKKIFMDSKKRIFNWAMDDKAMVSPCGTMQAAGVSLDWMNSEVSLEERDQARAQGALVQDIIEQEILHTAVGSKGVMFLPYLSGERSPYWNPDATGAFVGIRKDTSRHDLFRACYEGVALNLKSIWNIFQPINNARQLVLLGGQSCSKFNRQLIADALGITVVTHDHVRDSKNFGSAILGGIGIGIYKNFDVVKKLLHYDSALEPNPDHVAFYNGRLPLFQYAYTCLVPFYQKMRNDEGEGHVVV